VQRREGGREGGREGEPRHLVHEVLHVIDGEGLARINDAVEVGFHQVRDNVDVFEGREGGRGEDVQDTDDLRIEGVRERGRERERYG